MIDPAFNHGEVFITYINFNAFVTVIMMNLCGFISDLRITIFILRILANTRLKYKGW